MDNPIYDFPIDKVLEALGKYGKFMRRSQTFSGLLMKIVWN